MSVRGGTRKSHVLYVQPRQGHAEAWHRRQYRDPFQAEEVAQVFREAWPGRVVIVKYITEGKPPRFLLIKGEANGIRSIPE